MQHSDPLEAWVNESIEECRRRDYTPTEFIRLRRRGTVKAMEQLVTATGKIQSGLVRMKELGIEQEWSVEAGVLKFPSNFTPAARQCAQWRLDNIDDLILRR